MPWPPSPGSSWAELLAMSASLVEIPKSDGATHKQHRPPSLLSPVSPFGSFTRDDARNSYSNSSLTPSVFDFVIPLGLHIEIKNRIR